MTFAQRLGRILLQAFEWADVLTPEAESASTLDANSLGAANAESQTMPGSLIDILNRLERPDTPRDRLTASLPIAENVRLPPAH